MNNIREYNISESIFFRKTTEKWGGLSNMAKGYPLLINDISIQSSEILYQALRFTNFPEIQNKILCEKNPMYAKRIARKYLSYTRENWDVNRISIMKWCVAVKLCQNWDSFSKLLISTYPNNIIEYSKNDLFWGASFINSDRKILVGKNVLGRILMQLRKLIIEEGYSYFESIHPLRLNNFNLLGKPIETVRSLSLDSSLQGSFNLDYND